MAQVRKQLSATRRPRTPRQAAACCRPVDDLLEPALFKALGDPTRVRLLACVAKCGRACSVSEVAECCSVDLSVVSRHLQALARAGLIEPSRSGRTVSYAVRYSEVVAKFRALADAIQECAPEKSPCCEGGRHGCC
ncbi:MAG: metalloregulator ArsR/SmtB family transcription factor [Planctomycetota bacterium]|jgi:ArsR family transcriptional regulator|nr:metalloregulator ArsR/SmtB family transcription factor [Planctomycetota bacterium]